MAEAKVEEKQRHYPELRRRPGPGWWLSNPRYFRFMIRELTSFFIATYVIIFLYQIDLLATGRVGPYEAFVRNPLVVGYSIIVLGFTMYHALTWFYLTGRVMPIKVGPVKTTPWQALIINLVLMLIVSFVVITLFYAR